MTRSPRPGTWRPAPIEWIVEGDITACFDEISHPALMGRLRGRIADKRVLALVKAFLKAGILGQDGTLRDSNTGVPQGGILSPCWPTWPCRYWTSRSPRSPAAQVAPKASGPSAATAARATTGWSATRTTGCSWSRAPASTRSRCASTRRRCWPRWACACRRKRRRSPTSTRAPDFLGWHIQRHRKRGTDRQYIYTYPSRKAIKAATAKVKTICRRNVNQPLQVLIRQLNPALRGWCAYFRPGVSAAAFADLARYTLDRFLRWARRKHRRITVKAIRRRYCNGGWWPVTTETGLFNPANVATTRYRYRGGAIPAPWPASG